MDLTAETIGGKVGLLHRISKFLFNPYAAMPWEFSVLSTTAQAHSSVGKGQTASLTWNRFYKMYSLKHTKMLLISNVVIAYCCVS